MMMTELTIFTVVLALLSSLIIAEDACRFSHAKGTIDLSSLARTDGKAAYPDTIPATGFNYKYSYNPCEPFSEGAACQNVAACQTSMDGLYSFALGTQESASWNSGDGVLGGKPSVSYSLGEKKVHVLLECPTDGNEEFEGLGEDPTNFYKFRLTHKCACWNGCNSTAPETTTTTTTTQQITATTTQQTTTTTTQQTTKTTTTTTQQITATTTQQATTTTTQQTTKTTTTTTQQTTTTTTNIVGGPCRFLHTKGTIDLSSLARTDGKAAYPDVFPSTGSNYKYSYNPCKPFSEEPTCQNVAACQTSMDGLFSFALGTQESASWDPETGPDNNPSISYTLGEKKVHVSLECPTNGSEEFEVLGEEPANTYKFRLTHKCACWNGCNNTLSETTTTTQQTITTTSQQTTPPNCGPNDISARDVVVILLLVLTFVYSNGFAAY